MKSLLPRRDFLRNATLLTTGAVCGAASGLAPRHAAGIDAIARTAEPGVAQRPKFKYSLAAYSYRDLLSGEKPALTLEDFIVDCAKMGLEGTELTSYYFPTELTPTYLRRLKQLSFQLGLDISGTAVGNDFCHPAGPDRDKEIAHVKRWVDHAEMMGAPVIRIFSGAVKANQTEEQARDLAVSAIEECCQYAGEHGVFLALENHGGLTATSAGLLNLVKAVQSPWFGVNLDSGNFHGKDVYAELSELAPYAINVQIKVVVQPEGAGRQPSDFNRLAQILADAGYRGYIVLEYEEQPDPRQACPKYLDELRAAFSKLG